MSSTLSDQIGAMSIVDKLRFQTHRVQDFMNIAEQKAQLVQKIAAGYRAEGVTVSTETIEQGVEEWYKNRLTFKESETPWYFSLFISRDQWLKPVIFSIVTAVVIACAVWGIATLHHNHQLEEKREIIDSVLSYVADRPEIGKDAHAITVYPFVSETIERISFEKIRLDKVVIEIQTESNRGKQLLSQSEIPDLEKLTSLLRTMKFGEQEIKGLENDLASFNQHVNTVKHLKSDTNIQQFVPLQTSMKEIDALLLKPGLTIRELNTAISAFKSKIDIASKVQAIRTEVISLLERSVNQLTSDKDKELAKNVATRITLAIDALTMPNQNDLDFLRSIEQLSRTEIKLLINPFNKFKNGVERTFDETGGKAWYVIVQPLDETNKPVMLNIKDRESGREKMTNVFGIRVTKERYDQLKSDKADNGIIDDPYLGVKPVGKLEFTLEPNVTFENILGW